MALLDPCEVRQAVTARIAALTPSSAYRHQATDQWAQSSSPLVPELDPGPIEHLRFFVDDRTTNQDTAGDSAGENMLIRAPLVVRFLYRMRPTDRITDWDGAGKAAAALWRHLFADGWSEDLTLAPAQALVQRQILGDAIVVTLTVNAIYFTSTL